MKSAKENGIHLVCLPPNTTHALQPIDVGVFGHMKTNWKQILKQFKLKTQGAKCDKALFPQFIRQLYEESAKPEYLKSTFRASDIYPLAADANPGFKITPSLSSDSHVDLSQTPTGKNCHRLTQATLQQSKRQ